MVLPTKFHLLINIAIIIHIQLVSISICKMINPTQLYSYYCANTYGNFTNNSAYKTNLKTIFSNLISSITPPTYGFYNLSVGHDSNKAIGIALCRGDVIVEDCHSCLQDATSRLPQICPNQVEAVAWYEICMLRYSNRSTMEAIEQKLYFVRNNAEYITDTNNFYHVLGDLFANLSSQAAYSEDSQRKFAIGKTNVVDFTISQIEEQNPSMADTQTIYALTQCTPDLSQQSCLKCLQNYTGQLHSCCDNRLGAGVGRLNCCIRYEIYRFYIITNSSSSQAAGVVILTTVSIVSVILGIWIFLLKRNMQPTSNLKLDMEEIRAMESLELNLNTIKAATSNFSRDNKLGEGGFGEVYKGKFENGQEVAIKRLSKNSGQGMTEFKTEVTLVAKLQHRNLVKLLGFCITSMEKILVYEYLPNSSLDRILFDPTKCVALDWKTRFKIILGIARGLLYLHEDSRLKIIHRDLKSNNILLDESMSPKISDFGLAKLFGVDQTHGDTRRIVGTYGYMAPEYAVTGHFSAKSDVFSFGVLVIEIVSGKKNKFYGRKNDEEALLHSAWRLWNEEKILDLVDTSLDSNKYGEEVRRCIHIGLLCIQEGANDRPRMTSVVGALSGQIVDLPMPKPPHYFGNFTSNSANMDNKEHTGTENITNLYPR